MKETEGEQIALHNARIAKRNAESHNPWSIVPLCEADQPNLAPLQTDGSPWATGNNHVGKKVLEALEALERGGESEIVD